MGIHSRLQQAGELDAILAHLLYPIGDQRSGSHNAGTRPSRTGQGQKTAVPVSETESYCQAEGCYPTAPPPKEDKTFDHRFMV
jgi:hypothetical protein